MGVVVVVAAVVIVAAYHTFTVRFLDTCTCVCGTAQATSACPSNCVSSRRPIDGRSGPVLVS